MKNELTDEQISETLSALKVDWWDVPQDATTDFARAVIAAHEALQAGQEPALVQYRMAANWNEPRRWTDWDDCSPEAAADYERIKVLHDWEYQVRRLYAAPQPAPDKDAEIAALKAELARPESTEVSLMRAAHAAEIRCLTAERDAERERCAQVASRMTLGRRTLYAGMNGLQLAECDIAKAIRLPPGDSPAA